MDSLYFTCDWLVQALESLDDLVTVDKIAQESGCKIIDKGGRKTRDGYYVGEFILRGPSREVVERFLQTIKPIVELTNLQPADEGDFSGGSIVPVSHPLEHFAGVRNAAHHNKTVSLLKPTWFWCKWHVHPLAARDLDTVFAILEQSAVKFDFYYELPSLAGRSAVPPPQSVEFAVSVPLMTAMQELVDMLKPHMDFTDWVYQDAASDAEIESIRKPFIRDNASDFLRLVEGIISRG